jgi:ketosteroid isomerase-like protein
VLDRNLTAFFESYRDAFNQLDASAVARHFHTPSMLISGQGRVVWTTPDEVLANMQALVAHYRADGFARATFEPRDVLAFGDNAVVDIGWTIDRTGELAPRRFGTAYHLQHADAGWLVAVCTAYEEQELRD